MEAAQARPRIRDRFCLGGPLATHDGSNSDGGHSAWWSIGIVAAIMAAGFLWLAIDGGRGSPSGIQGRDGLASATALLPSGSSIPQFSLPALAAPPRAAAVATATSPGSSADNLTMLALGSASVLAVTGLAVLRARKRRPGFAPVAQANDDRSPTVV